ncbi:hypothetical protein ON010_g7915 [Phytophthora cinnamomi]|nr:hypothetical protein ON010_g7915 [Phytophthora cinnamomi]
MHVAIDRRLLIPSSLFNLANIAMSSIRNTYLQPSHGRRSRPDDLTSSTPSVQTFNSVVARFASDPKIEPQRLPNLVVTVKTKEPSSMPPRLGDTGAAPVKRNQFNMWLKSSFQWCVKALSLCCLRQQRHSESYTTCQGGPVLDSKPTISSNERGDSFSLDYVPLQSPVVGHTAHDGSTNGTANATKTKPAECDRSVPSEVRPNAVNIEQAASRHMEVELERQLARAKEPLDLSPSLRLSRHVIPEGLTLYERHAPPSVLYDDDDDLNMRSARLAAQEIEWCEEKPRKTSPVAPSHGISQKSGVWSSDEHERYCEALEIYRFGSWKQIAGHVGSRTERQVMSHAQSIRVKEKRAEERKKRHQTVKIPSSVDVASLRPTAPSVLSASSHMPPAKMRKLTPEELLLASMTHPVADRNAGSMKNREPRAWHHPRGSDSCVFTQWISRGDSDRGLNTCRCSDQQRITVVVDGDTKLEDGLQSSAKNVKTAINEPLCSSPLDILLEGVLSDEEILELLEIPATAEEIESVV